MFSLLNITWSLESVKVKEFRKLSLFDEVMTKHGGELFHSQCIYTAGVLRMRVRFVCKLQL